MTKDLMVELKAVHDRVKVSPENRGWENLKGLIELRNLLPEIISALKDTKVRPEEQTALDALEDWRKQMKYQTIEISSNPSPTTRLYQAAEVLHRMRQPDPVKRLRNMWNNRFVNGMPTEDMEEIISELERKS